MTPPIPWPFDWSVYLGLGILTIDYVLLAVGRGVRARNALSFALGVIALWVALESPIDTISDRYLMSVHMLQHVLLLFVAPPLLLLGLSPEMARTVARWPGVRALTRPVVAQVIAATAMIFWHLPSPYDWTLRSESVHIVEHLTFIAAGVIFWWPALAATSAATGSALGDGWKLLYLFVGTIPQDAVALPLLLSHVTFYGYYDYVPRLLSWLTPGVDQDIAGAVMMIVAKITIIVALLAIFFRWLNQERALAASADLQAARPARPASSGPPA
ncbi:MAG TPA: cytochrome c oxidase assembly protein [Candidatus Dormibacteraeota bacterium]